mmetsp:Transcript_39472/g.47881  ORF Transcript_39472/g.47881 Transcript_39472/m.47881 type:complete len:155 (-) Transcript_39472:95-559(-)
MAAEQGHPSAALELAKLHETGCPEEGVARDPPQACYWYEVSFKEGDEDAELAIAALRLAHAYENGVGVPQDNQIAMQWRSAAAQHSGASDTESQIEEVVQKKRNMIPRKGRGQAQSARPGGDSKMEPIAERRPRVPNTMSLDDRSFTKIPSGTI